MSIIIEIKESGEISGSKKKRKKYRKAAGFDYGRIGRRMRN